MPTTTTDAQLASINGIQLAYQDDINLAPSLAQVVIPFLDGA